VQPLALRGQGGAANIMEFFDAANLIHAAAVVYVIAFLARDELHLRLLALAGSSLYVLYYFFFPAEPLWDAIMSSSILIFANLIILSRILLERTTFSLNADEKQLFTAFDTLTPGQFRKVLKNASWHLAAQDTKLTEKGEGLRSLFYITEGSVMVEKSDQTFALPDNNFVGEIAYILEREPTATATAPAGTRYVEWDTSEMRLLSKKNPELGNALIALLTRDLAEKLSASHRNS